MSNFLKGRRGTTSIGEAVQSRLLALNAFTREPDEIVVRLRWARTPAVAEVWRCRLTTPRRLGEDLRQYLASEVWETMQGGTEPLADYDRDELTLPGSLTEMLLAQYEPRRPAVEGTPGEVQRVCVFYDPAALAWRVIQWSVPAAGSAIDGIRFIEDSGRLALSDVGEVAAYLIEMEDGRLVLDDTVASGIGLIATDTRILAY